MAPGEQIGDYTVVRILGEGGMSWVYQVRGVATHPNRTFRGRTFALKLMKPDVASAAEFVRRFEREADLQVALDHPNLLTIFDYGLDPGSDLFFYTMNFVDGADLGELVATKGPIDLARIEAIFPPILDALARLHEHHPSIVHRDVKPGNVLLTSSGHAYLSDLGIARIGDGRGHTRTSALLGTAIYLSPEQARGRDVDPSSDVFAIGLTLYEALAGHSAYDDIDDVNAQVESDVLGYLGHLERIGEEIAYRFPDSIPAPMQELIRSATRIRREDRLADAAELRAALHEALAAAPSSASAPAHARRPTRLRGWPRALAASAVAILAAGLLAAFIVRFPMAQTPRTQLEQLERLSERVETMIEEAPAADVHLADDLVQRLQQRQLLVRDLLNVGRLDAEIDRPESSQVSIDRAAALLAEICRDLTAGGLVARADRGTGEFEQTLDELRAVDAPRYAPRLWAELARVAGRLDAAVAGPGACEQARVALDRLAIRATAVPVIDAIYDELETLQPELARNARDRAARTRTRASARAVDARAYRGVLAEGDRSFRQGEKLLGNDDRQAGAHFRSAAAAYASALDVAPAAEARLLARKRVAEREAADEQAAALLESAERLYEAGSWREARTQYERALARQAGAEAREARLSALGLGAEFLEDDVLARGDQQLASGRSADTEHRYLDALAQLDRARAYYAEAERFARLAERRAWAAQRVAEHTAAPYLASGACEELPGSQAGQCRAGLALLEEGNEAVRLRQSATAIARYRAAEFSFRSLEGPARTGAAATEPVRAAGELTPPQGPVIVDRLPGSERVISKRGERVRLAVASYDADALPSTDPSDESLLYVWRIGGGEPFEGGSTLEIEFRRDIVVEVEVRDDDARTAAARARWSIEGSNHAPTLRVSPHAESDLRLVAGDSLKFTATADDADGDEVRVSYAIDGETAAQGRRLTFAKREPGRYDVRIIASDGRSETVLERSVEVQPAPEPEKPGLLQRLFFRR